MKQNKRLNIKNTIFAHISNNSKEYILVTLIFLIGIFLGVMFINNATETQISDIQSYLNNFFSKLENTEKLQSMEILKDSILENLTLGFTLWFFGTTVIGIPVVFGIILYRGFCLGYTISSIVTILGAGKGILLVLITLLIQNIIFIPSVIAISVSGFKLYKSIVKNRNRENIKVEILRHTIFSIIMIILLCISSVLEIVVSTNLLKNFIKYF